MKSNISQNHETLTEKQLKASQDIELTPDALETVSGGVDATPAFCKHCGARLINYTPTYSNLTLIFAHKSNFSSLHSLDNTCMNVVHAVFLRSCA